VMFAMCYANLAPPCCPALTESTRRHSLPMLWQRCSDKAFLELWSHVLGWGRRRGKTFIAYVQRCSDKAFLELWSDVSVRQGQEERKRRVHVVTYCR